MKNLSEYTHRDSLHLFLLCIKVDYSIGQLDYSSIQLDYFIIRLDYLISKMDYYFTRGKKALIKQTAV